MPPDEIHSHMSPARRIPSLLQTRYGRFCQDHFSPDLRSSQARHDPFRSQAVPHDSLCLPPLYGRADACLLSGVSQSIRLQDGKIAPASCSSLVMYQNSGSMQMERDFRCEACGIHHRRHRGAWFESSARDSPGKYLRYEYVPSLFRPHRNTPPWRNPRKRRLRNAYAKIAVSEYHD